MDPSEDLIQQILKRQNEDGGWPYTRGASWAEPTLYAALVLKTQTADPQALARALAWIGRQQRADGGIAPCSAVTQSTWVSALVLLFEPHDFTGSCYQQALHWVLGQTGQETNWLYRLRLKLNSQEDRYQVSGWPWFPGAASWVSPTSTAILGLRQAQRYFRDEGIGHRMDEGRQYLVAHTCRDGGWNHGSDRALGYSAESYPETTGAALIALRGVPRESVAASLRRAQDLAQTCSSSEGLSWLRMGLAAHGESVPPATTHVNARTLRDQCLEVLSEKVAKGTIQL